MVDIQSWLRRLDRLQQRHALLGFPLAVIRKFGDDQAGNLAALLAWNAFVSIFPLLLVLVTVLGIALGGHPQLQQQVLHSALADFPIIGTQLQSNVHSLNRTGIGLAVGLIGTFLGTRGVASAAQNAFNAIWEVPHKRRPGFPFNMLRSLALVIGFGTGILITTTLSGLGGGVGTVGAAARIAAIGISFVLNVGLFWAAFRLATAPDVPWRDLRLGAILAAAVWEILQTVGGYLVTHELRHANQVYGLFGIVLGLTSWLYLQAQLTLYIVEADVVRTRGLWPRAFFASDLTPADKHAYTAYAKVEERRPDYDVDVDFRP
jgi:membrane protein